MAKAAPAPVSAGEDVTSSPTVSAERVPFSHRVFVLVCVLGLLITAVIVWTAWALVHRNENRLLKVQTEQAGTVLLAALPSTETPLVSAVAVAASTKGSPAAFSRFISPYIGKNREFSTASLFEQSGSGLRAVASASSGPDFASGARMTASVAEALRTRNLVVGTVFKGKREHLILAFAEAGQRFAVYAEHPIAADRQSAVARNSAFSDLYYAIYLGRYETPADLLTYDFSRLPPTGNLAKVTVPFGDSQMTLVAAARGQLSGTLPGLLPWIFGVLGVLVSLVAAWLVEGLVRRRRSAERNVDVIGHAYSEQRTIAETLQRALLPSEVPDIEGLEVAVQYVPGTTGLEIGGDWYSVIPLDNGRFAFVVGDVSGRGLSAARVMAALRFTIRAYVLEGYPPETILEKCARHLQVLVDGHFATVLIGIGDIARHEITVANAGHFNPLLIEGNRSSFVGTALGLPLGVAGGTYESVTVKVRPKSTLIAFTDGLVENRKEVLDRGLERLEKVTRGENGSLDHLLSKVITDLTRGGSEDDIAMVGLRWTS